MKILKFIKGPGYLYDLCVLFILYFNQDEVLSEVVNPNKETEDSEYFNRILSAIGTVPEQLRVFFHLKKEEKSFLTAFYFRNKIDQVLADYRLDELLICLQNYNEVIENVMKHYFREKVTDLSPDHPEFIRIMGKRICNSNYDPVLKNSLYEFFLDPIPVIRTLCNELIKKEILLSKIYNEQDPAVIATQNKFNLDRFAEKISKLKTNRIDISCFDEIIVSLCAVNKGCIIAYTFEHTILFILGTDYEDMADYLTTKDMTPELAQFGIALSEENRIQILELLQEKGEMSVSELREELHFSHTNAYYHITLLLKSHLLAFRNYGRTVYYRINHDYFRDICTVLSKYKYDGKEKKL